MKKTLCKALVYLFVLIGFIGAAFGFLAVVTLLPAVFAISVLVLLALSLIYTVIRAALNALGG